jgi:seryl-tRNA synthetase
MANIKSLEKDLESFKAEQSEKTNQILGILETLVNKDKEVGQTLDNKDLLEEKKIAVEEEIQELTGKQRELFERYFDPIDGFKAWYNVNTNIFTIEVPMKLSNMIEAQRTLYKQDLRSKKVDQNNILGSIDQWCKMVCANLKYNRQIRLK